MAEMEGLAPGLLDAIKHLDHLDGKQQLNLNNRLLPISI